MSKLTKKELAEALIIAVQYMPEYEEINEQNYAENTDNIKKERTQVERTISRYEAEIERD